MDEWFEQAKNVAAIAKNITEAISNMSKLTARKSTEDAHYTTYKSRVSARKKTRAYRPEWDLLGRVMFNKSGKQIITEMDDVPDRINKSMLVNLKTGNIGIGPENAVEMTDGKYHYMLEIGRDPRDGTIMFTFFRHPA